VLEFNCRFGDPETQSIVPRLQGDFLGALATAAAGDVRDADVSAGEDAAVTIVLVAGDYPERGDTGSPITGIEEAEATGALVFHAGTALRDDQVVTNGGRVLDVTAVAPTIAGARERAYDAAARISFRGARYRTDIALEPAVV
jgi:phosphoribosylamine--glycine ligase